MSNDPILGDVYRLYESATEGDYSRVGRVAREIGKQVKAYQSLYKTAKSVVTPIYNYLGNTTFAKTQAKLRAKYAGPVQGIFKDKESPRGGTLFGWKTGPFGSGLQAEYEELHRGFKRKTPTTQLVRRIRAGGRSSRIGSRYGSYSLQKGRKRKKKKKSTNVVTGQSGRRHSRGCCCHSCCCSGNPF